MNRVELIPVLGMPEVCPGDDLAGLIVSATEKADIIITDSDVIAIAQKVVSKAEGRYLHLLDVEPSVEAVKIAHRDRRDARLVEAVLRESNEIVAASERALIVEHHSGAVCAHGGIDRSNLGGDENTVLLLPKNSDASAKNIRENLKQKIASSPVVIIVDTQGRAFRSGVVGVCIGCAGLEPLVDMRGFRDRAGRFLRITQVAHADEIAAAASMIMGQGAEGIPVVVIRGCEYYPGNNPASQLYRKKENDLFRC